MPKREIKVTINLPTSEEGKARLKQALVDMNSQLIANVLNAHPEIPYEAKVRWINSLNGVVPWAKTNEAEGNMA